MVRLASNNEKKRGNMFRLLQTIIILFVATNVSASVLPKEVTPNNKLHAIEREYHLKIGVYALDTNNGHVIAYHANDRFPFQSTCKFIGASALLANKKQLLQNGLVAEGLKLGFNRGTELPDPDNLLEGKGKISRYVEIKSEKQITSVAVKNLLAHALAAYRKKMAL